MSPLPSRRYVLDEDYTILGYTVPKGFLTNGADVPHALYPALPPNDSLVFPAVLLHDYLCDLVKAKYNAGHNIDVLKEFAHADHELKEALKLLEISNMRTHVYFYGVHGYTKFIRPFELMYYNITGKYIPVYKRNSKLLLDQIVRA